MNRELYERIKYSALGWTTSVEQTCDTVRLAMDRKIHGDFVECGVYAGAQAALMAHTYMDWWPFTRGPERRVHLFDTFDGIPAPGPEDTELKANVGGESRCSLPDVQAAMIRWEVPEELLVYHVGLFSATMPAAIANNFPEHIAVLRLDADLYSSTLQALQFMYPRVSPGGFVIVDDFNLSGCRKAVNDYFEHAGPAPITFRKHE